KGGLERGAPRNPVPATTASVDSAPRTRGSLFTLGGFAPQSPDNLGANAERACRGSGGGAPRRWRARLVPRRGRPRGAAAPRVRGGACARALRPRGRGHRAPRGHGALAHDRRLRARLERPLAARVPDTTAPRRVLSRRAPRRERRGGRARRAARAPRDPTDRPDARPGL